MNVVLTDNVTNYYSNEKLLMSITVLENDIFLVENLSCKIKGYCKKINDNTTEICIHEYYTKGKNGRLYKSQKLFDHNSKWFSYILKKEGFLS